TRFVLLDWQARQAAARETRSDFRDFFGQLWELQHQPGETATDDPAYLERLTRLMARSRDVDETDAGYVVLHNLPPIADLSHEDLMALQALVMDRAEAGLPLFVLLHESWSELLVALQRASDLIWALDESCYSAEFYLLHPHGFRTILAQNRRKPLLITLEERSN
ncbi:MAG: hypothetical protein ABI743_08590, partial [bacterium]